MRSPVAAANSVSYMRQLDGVRALAVGSVMWGHWITVGKLPRVITIERAGVFLFFVLSGFLITGILLKCRNRLDRTGESSTKVLRRFYMRRFLRIFPIYYGSILVLWLVAQTSTRLALQAEPMVAPLLPLLTYTFNLFFAVTGQDAAGMTVVWTLAVEEQFYLMWPFLILFAPRRWILPGILFAVALGPTYRFLTVDLSQEMRLFLTPACIDALAMGGLLAYVRGAGERGPALAAQLAKWAGIVGLVLLAWKGIRPNQYFSAIEDTALTLLGCWLVHSAATGFRGWVGRVLEWSPIVGLGKISYGLYLYHGVLTAFLWYPLYLAGTDMGSIWPFRPLYYFSATLVVSLMSWKLFEQPINRLKKRWPYFDTPEASSV